jgi:glycosyltransferase involved in cell wall biosynthesis
MEQITRVINQFDERVQSYIDTVMIVDNRSPDKTLEVAIEIGRRKLTKCNFIAWMNSDNYGLGGSHKAAFRYAVEQNFDFIVVLHGDDQADIRDLIPLLEDGSCRGVDCLLGARFMAGSKLKGYSKVRAYGNRVYNLLFSSATINLIHDLGSGLNLYRVSSYKDFYYKKFPDDLTFNYIMLLASYHRKQSVKFFPISWREDDQVSNVKLFRQAFKVLGMLLTYCLNRNTFLLQDLRTRIYDAYPGSIVFSQSSAAKNIS